MYTEIDAAIKSLASKVNGDIKPDDAQKCAQAALNLAHAKATLKQQELNAKNA